MRFFFGKEKLDKNTKFKHIRLCATFDHLHIAVTKRNNRKHVKYETRNDVLRQVIDWHSIEFRLKDAKAIDKMNRMMQYRFAL